MSEYFPHDADVGVIGRGVTIEAAFVTAAEAVFAVMAEPAGIRETLAVDIDFEEDDEELALVAWINALLTAPREAGAVFCRFALRRDGAHWRGTAWGDRWHAETDRGVEVKRATLTGLAVTRSPQGIEARCVVDV